MKLYRLSARMSHAGFMFLKRLTSFLDLVHTGFWLGILGEKGLDYSDELFYNNSKHYLDDKYNESGLYEWERMMIGKHFSNVNRILLIAAGGGRETLALGKMGKDTDSYECNPVLIAYGNDLLARNNIKDEIKYLPRNSMPEAGNYDGIIIGWGAYSLMRGKKTRLSFLEKVKPFMKSGTPLMISFLYTTERTGRDRTIKKISGFFRFFRRGPETELGDRLVPDFIHYFTEDEIRGEMSAAGLKTDDYYASEYGCLIAGIS